MAAWSDYGIGYKKNNSNSGLSDLFNPYSEVIDTFEDTADKIRDSFNSRNTYFNDAQSNSDLLSKIKGYNRIETINNKITTSDLASGYWESNLLSPVGKGISLGSGLGWPGLLAGLFGGAIAGVGNVFLKDKQTEDAVNNIEEIRKDVNTDILAQNEFEQQLFDTTKQRVANNMNRQAWSNMSVSAALGGPLHSYGADWRTGITEINNGGLHEQNPYEGVPFGVASDGQPNLVEEGEVIWNDYAFSNRLKAPKDLKKEYKFGGNITTFADIARTMKERYEERPNDPIAKRTLNDFMTKLAQTQEIIRQNIAMKERYKQSENLASLFADGGPIHIAKNKRGTFTAAATKHNMGVQEFASHVLANKDNFSPAMVKKANFAKNASKWKHALGGHLHWDGDWLDNPDFPIITLNPPAYFKANNNPIENNEIIMGNGDYSNFIWKDKDNRLYPDTYNDEKAISLIGPNNAWVTATRIPGDKEYRPWMGALYTEIPTLNDLNKGKREPEQLAKLTENNTVPLNYDTDKAFKKYTKYEPETKSKTNGWNAAGMAMRLASALGPALGALSAAWTKPKYEWSNELRDEAARLANTMSDISYNPIGQYLAYRPLDRNYYLNRLDSQISANRRAIRDLSGGNRAAALAAMNASDMAALDKYGQLARAGEEYNQAQRERVAAFNRDTDKFNSTMDLEAQKANASIKEARAKMQLQALMQALGWNRQDDMLHSSTLAANLSQLFNNIGGIGTEMMNREQQKALIESGAFGTMNDLMNALAFIQQNQTT